jgi:hypothetical protein
MIRRNKIAASAKFDFEQRQEVERVLEWLTDFPDEAAAYIVLLESREEDAARDRHEAKSEAELRLTLSDKINRESRED